MFGLNKKPEDWRILTLRVNTPEGQAERNIFIIKSAILRFMRGNVKLETNHSILITVKCRDEKAMNKIIKRATNFEVMIQGLWGKFAQKAVKPELRETVKNMFEKETSIDVVGWKRIKEVKP
jgi:hypothetical protein